MKKLIIVLAWMGAMAAAAEKPNLIVIFADDMGVTDIGAFHELYPGATEAQLAHSYTPNLDRLAKAGVRCTRAYAANWCAPSRQMLLSGQWVNRRNAYDHPWIGAQLRQAGYVTGCVGKNHGSKPIAKTYRNMDPETAEWSQMTYKLRSVSPVSYGSDLEKYTFPALPDIQTMDYRSGG